LADEKGGLGGAWAYGWCWVEHEVSGWGLPRQNESELSTVRDEQYDARLEDTADNHSILQSKAKERKGE
jgi:hypothetical protein